MKPEVRQRVVSVLALVFVIGLSVLLFLNRDRGRRRPEGPDRSRYLGLGPRPRVLDGRSHRHSGRA